jgi:hypothetical protein
MHPRPNPLGTAAVVATGLMAGLGVVGIIGGIVTTREARASASVRGPTTAPRTRPGGGQSGGEAPAQEEPRISGDEDQMAAQYMGHTALAQKVLNFHSWEYLVRVLGPDALQVHRQSLARSQVPGDTTRAALDHGIAWIEANA